MPVWHASAAPVGKTRGCERKLRPFAFVALAGVGNWSEQWQDFSGYAFHLRRRLTEEEQAMVGPAVDCRDSEEGLRRFREIKHVLPQRAILLASKELGNLMEKKP